MSDSSNNQELKVRIFPMFRDADADGRVGLKAYANYIQDMTTHHMHDYGKGNDTIPEEYGITWMFTKCKIHVDRKFEFREEYLDLTTWCEQGKSDAVLYQDLLISRGTEKYGCAHLECCLFNLRKNSLARMREIDFPYEVRQEKHLDMGRYERPNKKLDGFTLAYTHRVLYTDLDKTMHMNNVKYYDLFLNAFDSQFYQEHFVTDMEMHYLKQCYEKEEIQVLTKTEENRIILDAIKEDGSLAAQCILKI